MKTQFQILSIGFLFISLNVFAQWTSVLNPYPSNTKGAAIAVDHNGFIYAGGSTYVNTTLKENYYLVKYSSTGDTLWTRTYDQANGSDQIVKVLVDKNNDVIVLGSSASAANSDDIVLQKYNYAGTLLNSYSYDGINHKSDKAVDIIADEKDGNFYFCGKSLLAAYNGYSVIKTSNQLVRKWAKIESPQYGSVPLKISFNSDCQRVAVTGYHTDWYNKFSIGTIVYDSAGVKVWDKVHQKVSDKSAVGFDVKLMSNGDVFVCGYETNATTNKWEAIMIKYNNIGDTLWTRKIPAGEEMLSIFKSMTYDSNGNIYVTGWRGNYSLTAKYNQSGSLLWFKEQAGKYSSASVDTFEELKLDNNGNLLVLSRGYSENGVVMVLLKYSSSGELLWVKNSIGSPTNLEDPVTLTIDNANNIFVVGCSRNQNYFWDMVTAKFTPNSTGLPKNDVNQQFKFFPNPVKGIISFEQSEFNRSIEIISTSGSSLLKKNLAPFETSLSVENLPNGLYFISVTSNQKTNFAKLIIQK
jgi:hypothetical protein